MVIIAGSPIPISYKLIDGVVSRIRSLGLLLLLLETSFVFSECSESVESEIIMEREESDATLSFSMDDDYLEGGSSCYDEALNNIISWYEEAANREIIYLLHTVFPLTTNYFQIQCGLSQARSFCPTVIIQHNFKPLKISFSTFEWDTMIDLFHQLQTDFFLSGAAEVPAASHCGDLITVSPHLLDDGKMVTIRKYSVTIELFEQDIGELLKMNSNLISHQLARLDSLNFCQYYHNVLEMVSSWLKSNKISSNMVEEVILTFCSVSNGSLLSTALRQCLYYYKDVLLYDLNNK